MDFITGGVARAVLSEEDEATLQFRRSTGSVSRLASVRGQGTPIDVRSRSIEASRRVTQLTSDAIQPMNQAAETLLTKFLTTHLANAVPALGRS